MPDGGGSSFLPDTIRLLPRRIHVFHAAALVYLALKGTQKYLKLRTFLGLKADEDWAWSKTNSWCAHRLVNMAIRRGALWLKFAQYCTSRTDVLPPEYITVLDQCLDDAAPMEPETVLETVQRELGTDVSELFDGFDASSPIASASIAQVHRASVRRTGDQVVLKVQRPGVRALLLQDLVDLDTILRLVAGAEPEFDFRPMLQAWMDMVPKETDFLSEMKSSNEVSSVLTSALGTEFESRAFVPEILSEFTSEKLMCIRYIDGCGVKEKSTLAEKEVDCDSLVAEISKAFALQIHRLGKWSGDPHPGNILVELNEGKTGVERWRPGLIDFGITVELTEQQRVGFCRTVVAAVDNDSFSLLQSFADMDIVLNRADPVASMETIQFLFRATQSREDSRKDAEQFMKRAKERDEANEETNIAVDIRDGGKDSETVADDADARSGVESESQRLQKRPAKRKRVVDKDKAQRRNPVDAYPSFLVFMFRTLGLLRGLSTRLDVEHAYLPVMYEVAKKCLLDAAPPEQRIKSLIYPAESVEWQQGSLKSMSSRRANKLRVIVAKVLEALSKHGFLVGCQVAAFLDGKQILDVAAGTVGKYNPRPVTPSTLFCPFSATKGVMAILFAEVADEFGIESSDLVGKHWPAYACKGKEDTTIGHLLSHRAGLARAAPPDMRMSRLRDDWQGVVDWLATEAEPAHTPGLRSEYHFLNFGWLVAGLIQHVTNGASAQERLAVLSEKLGISTECYIGLPKELSADTPESRVAMLCSDIFKDIEAIAKRRRDEERESNSEDRDEAEVQGENVDKLYGESGDERRAMMTQLAGLLFAHDPGSMGPRGGIEDIAERSRGDSPSGAALPEANSADMASEDEGAPSSSANGSANSMDDLFKQMPYVLEPQYFSHPVLREAFVPSANGHFSARALAKLYAMLAGDGVIDGKRILAPGRVAQMMNTSTEPLEPGAGTDSGENFGGGVVVYPCVNRKGDPVASKAIGHQGVGGSVGFCIPDKKFAMAFTCNQLKAVSPATSVVVAAVCAVLNLPIPSSYGGRLTEKFRQEVLTSLEQGAESFLESFEDDVEEMLNRFNVLESMTGATS